MDEEKALLSNVGLIILSVIWNGNFDENSYNGSFFKF